MIDTPEKLAEHILGKEEYRNAPCQAHPYELIANKFATQQARNEALDDYCEKLRYQTVNQDAVIANQQARNEALESLLQAEQDSNHRLSAKELELAARNDALEAERDSLKDSLRRVLRKLPHVDRKILAERHGIKETDHE